MERGGGEWRLIKNTEEEGRRLVGESEKQASSVCNMDLVTLLFFPPVSLLTQLPSPAVHHPPDMNLILNLFISLHLRLVSFLFRLFSNSHFYYLDR